MGKQIVTPTPGAASELLPCPFCKAELAVYERPLSGALYWMHPEGECVLRMMQIRDARAWNTRATPPAPVTEGAQREAVADDALMERMAALLRQFSDAMGRPYYESLYDTAAETLNEYYVLCRRADEDERRTNAIGAVTHEMVCAALGVYEEMSGEDAIYNDMRATLEAADRARKPGYRQVTMDELTALVKEAMQDAWNDICIDSGHHPSDIKQCGRRELEFRAGQWASNVASFLMRQFKRENIGAVIPEASREPGQPWDGVGAVKHPEPPRE